MAQEFQSLGFSNLSQDQSEECEFLFWREWQRRPPYVQNLRLGHTSFRKKKLEFKRFGDFGTFLSLDFHGITQRYTD